MVKKLLGNLYLLGFIDKAENASNVNLRRQKTRKEKEKRIYRTIFEIKLEKPIYTFDNFDENTNGTQET